MTINSKANSPVEFYPPVTPKSYTLKFTEVDYPMHPALHLIAELVGPDGGQLAPPRRFWAAWGNSKTDLFEKAVQWLDNCHGRAGHTPSIIVSDSDWISHVGPLFEDWPMARGFFGLDESFQYSEAQILQYIKEFQRAFPINMPDHSEDL